MTIILTLLFTLLIHSSLFADDYDGIVINEFSAANTSANLEPRDYNYSDWIELYNSGNRTIDLRGCFLTDDLTIPRKFRIYFHSRVRPGDFILIWADGVRKIDHVNFKLDRQGETLALFNPHQELIDIVHYNYQYENISYGRDPKNLNKWCYFEHPTPTQPNRDDGFVQPLIAAPPRASQQGGFYSRRLTVTLTTDSPSADIRYTLDGSIPTRDSNSYITPIRIYSTTVLRMRTFDEGVLPSPIVTETYFINETPTLPIISIAMEPDHLFDNKVGMYVEGTNGKTGNCSDTPKNWNQDWERPAHIEFYEPDTSRGFKQDVGIKIYGGCSRKRPLKSLAVFARNQYGSDSIKYQLFPDKDIHQFKTFVLRNSGNDNQRSYSRDGLMQTIVKNQLDVDWQAYRPAIVFLNGEYWGIHNIREKINEHYASSNYGIDPDEIDLLEKNQSVIVGSGKHYADLLRLFNRRDINDAEIYQQVKSMMDINEYINYQITQIYYANTDWPGNNIKYWRPQTNNGRWRWVLFDLDFGFNLKKDQLGHNTLAFALDPNETKWPNPSWSTRLFRELMEHDPFKQEFLQRFLCCMETVFQPDRMLTIIDDLASGLEPEMERHLQRWDKPDTLQEWEDNLEELRNFASYRTRIFKRLLQRMYDLADPVTFSLNIKNHGHGTLVLNHVPITEREREVEVYPDFPLEIKAIPKPGYAFDHWIGFEDHHSNILRIIPKNKQTITAAFKKDSPLVINELYYHPNNDSDETQYEFIELFNAGKNSIDLTGYRFTQGIAFTFPEDAILPPSDYVLVAKNAELYQQDGIKVYQWFDGKLSNKGESICLVDSLGQEVDSLEYGDGYPWPSMADGYGYSLSLTIPALDNTNPAHWRSSSKKGGTPGYINFEPNETTIEGWTRY